MKMTKFEKLFVNRKKKADGNIKKVWQSFEYIELEKINKILELGCGIGFVSIFLSETYNMNVYGTDFDPAQIELARKIHPENNKLHFSVEDAKHLNFKDSEFDLVLSQNVFHHIPDWEFAVSQIYRVLRPHGYFIWIDLTFPNVIKKIFQPLVKNYGLYTYNDIKSSFKSIGFKELFYERLVHGPFGSYHMVLQKI
jgi:ubiquinone/menaquinone biosynthesis C-methylase UbiE